MKKILIAVMMICCLTAGLVAQDMKITSAKVDGKNFLRNGDFEKKNLSEWVSEGSVISVVAKEGIDNSNAMLCKVAYDWSGIAVDMTKLYAPGKSYYIEAWFKAASKMDKTASITFCVEKDCDYEYDNAYDYYSYMPLEAWGTGPDGKELTGNEQAVNAKNYVKVNGYVSAEEIAAELKNAGDAKVGKLVVYFKLDGQTGKQNYYIDNVTIVDLNPEIPAVGKQTTKTAKE